MIIAKILSFGVAVLFTALFLHNTALLLSPSKNVAITRMPPVIVSRLAAFGWIIFYALHLV
jgi:hypothetical protein